MTAPTAGDRESGAEEYITTGVAIGLGSIHESRGQEGLAHLFEHLVVARLKRAIEECRQDRRLAELDVTVSARTYTFHTEISIDLLDTGDSRSEDLVGHLYSLLRDDASMVSVGEIAREARSIDHEVSTRGGVRRIQRTPAYVPHAVYTDRPGAPNSYALSWVLTGPEGPSHCAHWQRAFREAPVGIAVRRTGDIDRISAIMRNSVGGREEPDPADPDTIGLRPWTDWPDLENRPHTRRHLDDAGTAADGWVSAAWPWADMSSDDLRAAYLVMSADDGVMSGRRFGLYGPLRGPDGWVLLSNHSSGRSAADHWFGPDGEENLAAMRTRAIDTIDEMISSNEGISFSARENLFGTGHGALRDAVSRVRLPDMQDLIEGSAGWRPAPFVMEKRAYES